MTVILHRLAIQEFVAARRFYRRIDDETEARFVDAIRAAVIRIEDFPLLGHPFRDRYRWVRTRRYQFVLYYEIMGDGVEQVYAVAHARRRPSYWMKRVRKP